MFTADRNVPAKNNMHDCFSYGISYFKKMYLYKHHTGIEPSCRNKASKFSHCSLKVKLFYPCEPMAHVVSSVKMKGKEDWKTAERRESQAKKVVIN